MDAPASRRPREARSINRNLIHYIDTDYESRLHLGLRGGQVS